MNEYEARGPMQNIHISSEGEVSLAKDFMETLPFPIRTQVKYDSRSDKYLRSVKKIQVQRDSEPSPNKTGPGP